MAATEKSTEFSRAVKIWRVQVTDLANRLSAAIPQMEQNISKSDQSSQTIAGPLRDESKHIVDELPQLANIVDAIQTKAVSQDETLNEADKKVIGLTQARIVLENRMAKFQDDVKNILEANNQQARIDAQAKIQADVKAITINAKLE